MFNSFAMKAVAGLSILACWGASLLLPVVQSDTFGGTVITDGWTMLFTGWLGPLIGQFGWFANLILFPALGLAAGQFGKAPRRKLVFGAILLLLVVNSAFWSIVPDDAGEHRIIAYLIGYWLWMLAMASAGLWLVGGHLRQARELW